MHHTIDIDQAYQTSTVIYQHDGHAIYWLGLNEPTAFRTNSYLVYDGDHAVLIDPGNRACFPQLKARVAQILPPEKVTDVIVCHQDPDVAASLPDWLQVNPSMRVHTSPRTRVLLAHYGIAACTYIDTEQQAVFTLSSGAELHFVPAPFLHFPGAFASYDTQAKALFTGDVFASLDVGKYLWADDFDELAAHMRLFHVEYMASNIAVRGFVRRLDHLQIDMLLPQHGQLIGRNKVAQALRWLAGLSCGTDLIYPDLSDV